MLGFCQDRNLTYKLYMLTNIKQENIMKQNSIFLLLLISTGIFTNVIYAQDLPKNNGIISKYDFIPGEKLIFFDDFTDEGVGDFPAQWLTNGSGEIINSTKLPGRWFRITKGGYYIPDVSEDFTDNYTIEFDIIPINIINSETATGIDIFLLSGSLLMPDDGAQPGKAGVKIHSDHDKLYWNNWSEAREWQGEQGDVGYTLYAGEKYHISLSVQKQRLRLYVNDSKVLDLPRGLQAGYKYNIFRIETSNDANPIISNFRIAVGLFDMRNRLLKDGKIISYGIAFEANSDKLKPESYATIKEIADILSENPTIRVQIVCHTDSDGDEISNLDLSKRRAIAVKNELVSKFDIDDKRLEAEGKGESTPVVVNDSAMNKAKNRRVEFIVKR